MKNLFFAAMVLLTCGAGLFPEAEVENERHFDRVACSDPTRDTGIFSEYLPVESGKLYEVSGQARTKVLSPQAINQFPINIFVHWFDAKKYPLKGKDLRNFVACSIKSHDWKEFRNAVKVPDGAAFARLRLQVYNVRAESDFSDVRFTRHDKHDDDGIPPADDRTKWTPQASTVERGKRGSISLAGVWGFLPLYSDSQKLHRWETIRVPSLWGEVPGFNNPPAWKRATEAVFRREFTVPESWRNRRVALRFGAVLLLASVEINGRPAGKHGGGFTPFELDITSLLRSGANELTVHVKGADAGVLGGNLLYMMGRAKWYCNQAKGGIWQDVTLESFPGTHVAELQIKTSVAHNELSVSAVVENRENIPFHGLLRRRVVASPGATETIVALPDVPIELGPRERRTVPGFVAWEKPRLWSPEDPHLYFLESALIPANEAEGDLRIDRFGFREFCIRGRDFYLNGKLRRLRGDAVVPVQYNWGTERRDYLRLMYRKFRNEMNLNLIRFHVLPGSPAALEVADEMGMLVDQTSALVGGGNNGSAYLAEATREVLMGNLQREFTELVKRDLNHPSVVIWTLENEMFSAAGSPTVPITKLLEKTVRELDGSRVIARSGAGRFDGSADFYSYHAYDSYLSRQIARFQENNADKPVVNAEYWASNQAQIIHGDSVYRDMRRCFAAFGEFFKEYNEYWRARGAAGLYPFDLHLYCYAYPGAKRLKPNLTNSAPGEPEIDYVGFYALPLAGTDQFNPNWRSELPESVPNTEILTPVAASLRPVHVMFREINRAVRSGEMLERTLVLVNDSDETIEAHLSAMLGNAEVLTGKNVKLSPGEILRQPLRFNIPMVNAPETRQLKVSLKPFSENEQTLHLYPAEVPAFNVKNKRIAFIGNKIPGITAERFVRAGIFEYDLIIIGEDSAPEPFTTDRELFASFLEKGGNILLLRQQADWGGLLPGRPTARTTPSYIGERYRHPGFPRRYERKSRYVHATDPASPLWQNLIEPRLANWRTSDHCVANGVFSAESLSGNRLIHGYTVDDVFATNPVLVEFPFGRGRLLATQIELAPKEPESIRFLANAVNYLLTSPPPLWRTFSIAGESAKKLVSDLYVKPEPAGEVILAGFDAPNPGELLQATQAGATIVAAVNLDSKELLHTFGLKLEYRSFNNIIPSEKKPEYLRGMNGFDFKRRPGEGYDFLFAPTSGLHIAANAVAVQNAWEYPYENNPIGGAIVERAIGKGRIIALPYKALSSAPNMASLLTALGVRLEPPLSLPPRISVLRAGKITLDGNLHEWTYDRTEEELVDFCHAKPVALSSRTALVRGAAPTSDRDLSGVAYFMYDDRNFYFAARIVDDKLVFNRQSGMLYQADGLDFCVGGVQVIASLADGKPILDVLSDSQRFDTKEQAEVLIRPDPAAGDGQDQETLQNVKGAPGYTIEGRIALELLFPDGPPPRCFPLSVGFNDCDNREVGRKTQLYFPPSWRWNRPESYATGELIP